MVIDLGICYVSQGSPPCLSNKRSTCNAGDTGDVGWIPGSGLFPGRGHATQSGILTGKIRWTDKPGGLKSMGLRELDTTKATEHICMLNFKIHT